ncbi:MAG: hypothetical protein Q9186_001316 [Xanthomendoza sp. 1 TL-2023]
MALLGDQYASSDEEVSHIRGTSNATTVVAAPDVSLDVWSHSITFCNFYTNNTQDPMRLQLMLAKPTDTALTYNATAEDLARPSQGPRNPYKATEGNVLKRKNALTGDAQETAISDSTFSTLHRTWQSLGYTKDPSVNGAYVGDLVKAQQYEGKDIIQMRPSKEASAALRRKRQKKGKPSIVDGPGAYLGPWAQYTALGEEESASDEEYREEDIAPTRNTAVAKLASDYQDDLTNTETTQFEGTALSDYQGRSYMHVPLDLDVDLRAESGTRKNYIPKKLIHTFRGHSKAINALRFFPNHGHLLLSASADTKVKLWDLYHDRELLRTYSGAQKAITDATFDSTGGHFLTGSYDRYMKLWDTETGACVSRFQTSTKAIPHVVRFYPVNNNEFLVGTSDKKIVQFDTRSGEQTQEYDHHLQAVNTITFCDENRRFMTTSDDKSLRCWEFGLPVPIKFIAEPYMFSLVRAAPHPNGKSVAFQSGDNQIVVYASTDRFRQNRKKSFRGHNNAGYAIDLDISPDGQFVCSGDSGGYVCFYDWKSCKMWHKIKADDGPVVRVAWHPQESSKVVTAGIGGEIKLWD